MVKFYVIASEIAKMTGHNTFEERQLGKEKAKKELIDLILNRSGIVKKYIPNNNIERKIIELPKEKVGEIKKELINVNMVEIEEAKLKVENAKIKKNDAIKKDKSNSKLVNEIIIEENKAKEELIIKKEEFKELKNNKNLPKIIKKKIINESLSNDINEEESIKRKNNNMEKLPNIKSVLKEEINHDLQINRGIIKENNNLNKIEKNNNINIKERNDILYKKLLYKDSQIEIILRGMLDGVHEDHIIETKNRKNRLFKRIPDYEKVQLNAYMFLTNKNKVIHTEHYNEEYNIIEYDFDNIFWEDCKIKIINFIKEHM